MATPKLDRLCVNFVKRIPDQFKSSFTPGGGVLPDSNLLKAEIIADYVNRGIQKLFNEYWAATKGDPLLFSRLFPELVKYSDTFNISNGIKLISSPYLDLKRVTGAIVAGPLPDTETKIFTKIWDETIFTIAVSGIYDEYIATGAKPALIQMNNRLYLFPDYLQSSGGVRINGLKIQYIATPVSPTTGSALVQNGDEDCPFSDEWNNEIVNKAYQIFLDETAATQ